MACIKTEEPQWEAGSTPHSSNKTGQKNIIQIYTDWANHYLDKGKCKRHIQSLQNDVVDGVIISDVIEAVTGQKVADVNRRPKTRAQMLQNLDLCLAHLRSMGVVVDDVQSDDVIDGKLKPILGLFFQLSRHKQQQQKRKTRPESSTQHAGSKVPAGGGGGGKSGISCIPSARDRQVADNKTKQSLLQKPSSAASSRSTSPTSVSGSRSRLGGGQRSGLSTPRMGRAAAGKAASSLAGAATKSPQTRSGAVSAAGPAAAKDKSRNRSGGNVIKRTSSSSGFSSARSEKSDSSSNVNTADSSSTGTPVEPAGTVPTVTAAARSTPDNYGSLSRRGGQRSLLQAPQQRAGRPSTATAAAKRRSLAGSQTSLASSCGGGAPTSAIPKPAAAATVPAAPAAAPAPAASAQPASSAHGSAAVAPGPPPAATAAAASRSSDPEEKALVQLPRQRQLGRGRPAPAVSVALVSPMPHTPEQERAGDGSGHSAGRSTANDQPARRAHKETGTEPAPAPGKAAQEAADPEQELTEDVYSLRPMQPILRLSQYGYSRGGMALAGRRQHNQHNYGYMSDTDGVSEDVRYDAVLDGYMSEDGLYARNPAQVKYSSVGEEASLWRVAAQQKGATMASDRPAYYSYTDAPGSQFIKQKAAHPADHNRFGKKERTPEFRQISNTQWKRAVEGRRPPGDLSTPSSPAPEPRHGRERERSATPVGKHKRENGTNTPEPTAPAAAAPAAGAAAESPNLKFSRQKLRKSAASYAKRPTSQTSVSSAGSAGLPPKDPEHRPRTKVKVSGSTQTTAELLGGDQERRLQQLKSYSLTGPAAQQLSQSVRERILAGGDPSFSTLPAAGQRPRPAKVSDGSLSDSNYSPYGDPRRQPAAPRPSSAYTTYVGQQLAKTFRGSMTEAESMESVSSGASGLLAQLHQQRSGSLTQNRLLNYGQWEGNQGGQSPRLSRSNSIRSTKSEKLYSNLLQRGASDEDPYYSALVSAGRAEPPSPTPSPSRASFPLSPGTVRSSYGARSSKDDDAHGSSLSLVSTTSSIYSAQEEKQASEYRRLKRDLLESQEKVQTLTNQLTTNAHVVEAFEQSLTSMTKKLHQVTLNSEQKDKDIAEMRKQVERLQRALAASGGSQSSPLTRQTSNESISSMSSACSAHSQQSSRTPDSPGSKKKKKKGWFSASPQLRTSFGKAFSRRKPKTGSDLEDGSAPSSPVMASRHGAAPAGTETADTPGRGETGLPPAGPVEEDLRRQLREKDTALTDMRLEALSSHHQLETLKETVSRVRKEMACMRQDNERLQRLVASRSANSSRSSLAAEPGDRPPAVPSPTAETAASRLSEQAAAGGGGASRDQKVLTTSVRLGDEDCQIGTVTVARKTGWDVLDAAVRSTFKEYLCRLDPDQSLGIDADAITGYRLGEVWRALTADAEPPELLPWGYTVGDVRQAQLELRGHEAGCVDAFVFETLIPKPIVHRYVSILVEHRRVILCGQSGTGKTYLARRLAEYLVRRSGAEPGAQTVATVTVEPGGGRELHQYLAQLSERCRQSEAALPHCLILDNLHHVQALADVFNGFLSTAHTDPRCPYIIGTLSQPAGTSTELQLHHNFRWVLCANHVEPVRGFLGRHLRRRLAGAELASGSHDPQLRAVFEWVPRVWLQLNKFLETHSSADVTMGPRLLLNCPCDLTASQVWFTGVWNYSIVPYLVETVREGLLIYGRRASWHDPTQFVLDTYPWPRAAPHAGADSLTRLRPEDVGYESATVAAAGGPGAPGAGPPPPLPAEHRRPLKDTDPLLSMLRSLQEAANYSPMSGRPSSAATSPDRPHEPPAGRRSAGQATL